MKVRRGLLAAALLASIGACKPPARSAGPGGGRLLRLGVIPKGSTHEFWKTVEAGVRAAADELAPALLAHKPKGITGLEILWKGPLREDDREQQIQVIEGFTSQAVDGILLAPLDAKALVRPVEEALRLGIPTVVFDSGLDYRGITSFVATDNETGGALAADQLAKLLGGKGKVILLRYQQGSASTEARERGFLQRLAAAYPDVQLLSADQHAGPTRDSAKRAAENLLNRFGADVQGFFAPNEPATVGTLLALQDIGKAGQTILIGFDCTPGLLEGLKKKQIHGLVVQDPRTMGNLAVRAMVKHLTGEPVDRLVKTDALLVTADNLNEPRIARLVAPLPPEPNR